MRHQTVPKHGPKDTRYFACLAVIAVGVLLTLATTRVEAAAPNIVYIMADDLGIGDVECYGGDRCQIDTPHIDALATAGMKFTDAHAPASVCVPTRVAIMTGRYAWRFQSPRPSGPWGFLNPRIDLKRLTLGKMLRAAGYRTGYVGKWHLGTLMQTFSRISQCDPGQSTYGCSVGPGWGHVIPARVVFYASLIRLTPRDACLDRQAFARLVWIRSFSRPTT
jgi:hypothetical protein